MKRTEDMEFAEENEISIMSTDQAYETTSEAVDESGYSQASSAMSSQPLAPTTKRTMRLAVGPFRALLASRELVTLAELGAILRRTGHDASDSLASLVAQELQRAGILGEHVRGRGTKGCSVLLISGALSASVRPVCVVIHFYIQFRLPCSCYSPLLLTFLMNMQVIQW